MEVSISHLSTPFGVFIDFCDTTEEARRKYVQYIEELCDGSCHLHTHVRLRKFLHVQCPCVRIGSRLVYSGLDYASLFRPPVAKWSSELPCHLRGVIGDTCSLKPFIPPYPPSIHSQVKVAMRSNALLGGEFLNKTTSGQEGLRRVRWEIKRDRKGKRRGKKCRDIESIWNMFRVKSLAPMLLWCFI